MPLSEHEQRMLDQIESALYAEDPKFASNVRGGRMRAPSSRRRFQAAALFVLGLVLLIAGVALPLKPGGFRSSACSVSCSCSAQGCCSSGVVDVSPRRLPTPLPRVAIIPPVRRVGVVPADPGGGAAASPAADSRRGWKIDSNAGSSRTSSPALLRAYFESDAVRT